MAEVKITVYKDEDLKEIKQVHIAKMRRVPFGAVRKVMALFNVENMDTGEILKTVLTAWDEVVRVLNRFFPDITEEEWDYVDSQEVMQAILGILQLSIAEMVKIPKDPN